MLDYPFNCRECGLVVMDAWKHREWHKKGGEMRLPEEPTIPVSVRKAFADWWWQQKDVEKKEDEMLQLVMQRAAFRELWRYIRDCEELIENTRVRGR